MLKTSAGKFEITSYGGYPYWIEIKRGDVVIRIHHQELKDLEYAINRHRELLKVEYKNYVDEREF